MYTIIIGGVLLSVCIALGISLVLRKKRNKRDALNAARERAEQRRLDRRFMNTTPVEDAYEKTYSLSDALSATEVNESANGYGPLDKEQKRVIAAIFDNRAQVQSSIDLRPLHGARWAHSVFGDFNRVAPLADHEVWASSTK